MSPGNPCQHCTSQGCAIYATRPADPCASFHCGWLKKPDLLPDDMRPDLSGAIVMFNQKWNDWLVIKAIPWGTEIPTATLERLKALASEQRTPLLFYENLRKDGRYSGLKGLGYGPPAFLKAVEQSIGFDDMLLI